MRKFFTSVDRAVEALVIAIFVVMVVVGGMQVFNRYVLNRSLSWSEEFQKFTHVWLVYLAIPIGYRRGSHIGMDIIRRLFPIKLQTVLEFLTNLLWLLLAGVMVYYTLVVMEVAKRQTSPGMGVRMDFAYLGLVIGGAYLAFVVLRQLFLGEFTADREERGPEIEGLE